MSYDETPVWDDFERGYAEDDEVSLSRIAKLTDTGEMCCECGAQFTAAHGRATACTHCWAKLPATERAAVLRATHDEKNQAAHKQRARTRRAARERQENQE